MRRRRPRICRYQTQPFRARRGDQAVVERHETGVFFKRLAQVKRARQLNRITRTQRVALEKPVRLSYHGWSQLHDEHGGKIGVEGSLGSIALFPDNQPSRTQRLRAETTSTDVSRQVAEPSAASASDLRMRSVTRSPVVSRNEPHGLAEITSPCQ